MANKTPLTRELLISGGLDSLALRSASGVKLLSEQDRAASLLATLAQRPNGEVWVFGYGSLIWNPMIAFEEKRVSIVNGWHRAFCLSSPIGRGTVEAPALTLALDRSGSCTGVAFRIPLGSLEEELSILWRREMLTGAYAPTWVDMLDVVDLSVRTALTFTVSRSSPHYAGALPRNVVVERLATASGILGSAAEYLFQTCNGLKAHGVSDPEIELLAAEVRQFQSAADKENKV